MTQKDRDLLFKDLCGRLPYKVVGKFTYMINNETTNGEDVEFTEDYTIDGLPRINEVYASGDTYNIDEVRPYLRSMNSITKNEKKEFRKVMYSVEGAWMNAYGKGGYTLAFTDLDDWLNKHHFDYRGLIPVGLALEAPEGMYKTE